MEDIIICYLLLLLLLLLSILLVASDDTIQYYAMTVGMFSAFGRSRKVVFKARTLVVLMAANVVLVGCYHQGV